MDVATNFDKIIVEPICEYCNRTIDVGPILGGLINLIRHPGDLRIALHHGLSLRDKRIESPMSSQVHFRSHQLTGEHIIPVMVYCSTDSDTEHATDRYLRPMGAGRQSYAELRTEPEFGYSLSWISPQETGGGEVFSSAFVLGALSEFITKQLDIPGVPNRFSPGTFPAIQEILHTHGCSSFPCR